MGIFNANFRDTRKKNEENRRKSKKMLKGYGIPRPPPPHGASLFGDLLKRKKNPRGVEEEGKELALFLLFGL